MSYYGGYGSCNGGILGSVLGMAGGYGGGGYGGYGRCGADNIFYRWRCCDYSPYECCIQLETWVVVFLVIFIIGFFVCLCACLAGCVWSARNRQ
ncbi:Protein CBG18148 [Caenorhabditis briggsae]|uniref:Uncharacterized protein n=3 Tax=Caenorhabditis TaxID=6237 RepID=A0AAE9IQ57_CAEBR|nr:Protein CBG18148 [Caenorhabditis briggsae]PIC43093.1 hypothetical protein B9Z55_009968 [Caenorhabditis nigoni]ULU00530.1 hypothetical protein L3Y34_001178 [Caenorhabditis briggsae]UMM23198.1 hypothetical protein L5515_004033 [Caenorhabditis briggsae]CAP35650.1 Protein CBG18148 [Caenorhabditis briggsae]